MLTNCLAACAHLTITVSEIERDIGRKSSFLIPPCIWRHHQGGFRWNSATPFGTEKLEWCAWLPNGEKISKISLFVSAQLTNVTDTHRQTHRQTHRHLMPAYTALMHMDRAVKRYGHSCNGRRKRTCMRSIEWCHFQWPWVTLDLDFKVTIFNVKYLENGTWYSYS